MKEVEQEDIKDLIELLKLKPWQIDRVGYWYDTIEIAQANREKE